MIFAKLFIGWVGVKYNDFVNISVPKILGIKTHLILQYRDAYVKQLIFTAVQYSMHKYINMYDTVY